MIKIGDGHIFGSDCLFPDGVGSGCGYNFYYAGDGRGDGYGIATGYGQGDGFGRHGFRRGGTYRKEPHIVWRKL